MGKILKAVTLLAVVVLMVCGGSSTGGGEVSAPSITTFTDDRDGKSYKKITIGTQTWMGENLNYAADGSRCYNDINTNRSDDDCEKYGRYYDWETARTACPSGWHFPTDDEWTVLVNYAGGEKKAGKKLKSTSGWNDNSTDDYGFSALPGGSCTNLNNPFVDFTFSCGNENKYGMWWSATESESGFPWYRRMDAGMQGMNLEYVSRWGGAKNDLYSVRCVQD